ncbi:putative lactonohydrolase protein [Phaeoacremonium minimum UCRPA7]|uniref:Putative lactonohydrolase protein n=1 Tax=Phaeoacremonium minimum (strain UCR-PA7) TaxID=1286976 RepID=R8BL95_PHAM7|nr:putative lactonohydrolase protein [Phaeoacremonium minimum UCRPA7]EOO00133.1 putative lactonohydrolase protein [Phaeoacremonium minimum UCRPA7]
MSTMKSIVLGAFVAAIIDSISAQTGSGGVSIPPEYYYLLPAGYEGSINANFIDTETGNSSIDAILAAARNSTFYAYDDSFYTIVDASPQITTISASNSTFVAAKEGGVWVPEHNQVWFDGGGDDPRPYYILDMSTYEITPPGNNTIPPIVSGGSYHDGAVYFASLGLKSLSAVPAIYAIDVVTGSSSCAHPGEDNLFFTTLDLGANGETWLSDAVLPNAVWRFTPSTKTVQAVISRGDILAPNGIAADPNGNHLYVSDVALVQLTGPGSNSSGSPAIYKFDLDADCNPVNKRLFAIDRSGLADGMKVDNYGRVWTAEWNGIVVRDSRGRELGVFNGEQLVEDEYAPIENFALAGDKLVILAGDKILVVQLNQDVTDPASATKQRRGLPH